MSWTREAGLTAADIDAKRKEFLAGCGFDSLTKVDRVNGFTKVLSELLVLQGTSLQAGLEADDQTINKARVLRHQIASEIIPCLELYIEDVPGYLRSIMEDKNRWWKIDRPACDITILDLDAKPIWKRDKKTGKMRPWPSQLEQLQYTLAARLNDKRNEAGHTIHDMKIRAGVPCGCSKCQRAEFIRQEVTAGEVHETDSSDAWWEQESQKEDEAAERENGPF